MALQRKKASSELLLGHGQLRLAVAVTSHLIQSTLKNRGLLEVITK